MIKAVMHLPFYVTYLALLYVIYMGTAGVQGEHKMFYRSSLIIGECVFLGILSLLFPNVTCENAFPVNLAISGKFLHFYHLALLNLAIGIPLSCITWFFKHDFRSPEEQASNNRNR